MGEKPSMAVKIKKTRPELLKQRRALATAERYLPTLALKKQQIQMEILKVRAEREESLQRIARHIESIDTWVALLSESLPGSLTRLVRVTGVTLGERNVAGIPLPVLTGVDYEVRRHSLFALPPWVDAGIAFVKELLELREEARVIEQQELLLRGELRKVSQRVNLFEKVIIPRAKENIRVIRIQLGEQEVAGVGRSKIAKAKSGGDEEGRA
jgi:V/A-type H+-transporting ATPase subunit D